MQKRKAKPTATRTHAWAGSIPDRSGNVLVGQAQGAALSKRPKHRPLSARHGQWLGDPNLHVRGMI